jgi:Mat/Ecp fimbriae major subunit
LSALNFQTTCLRRVGACALIAIVATMSTVGRAETQTADARARIYQPIHFAVLLELDFGTVVSDPTGGTIVLDPATNTRDCAGGSLVCTGSFSWSRLQLTGSDATVVVTYAPNFTLTGPGDPITAELDFPGGSGTSVALTGGSTTIELGAKLHVNPNQVPGPYSGLFSVDVNYQ